jgi:hypothetical protein
LIISSAETIFAHSTTAIQAPDTIKIHNASTAAISVWMTAGSGNKAGPGGWNKVEPGTTSSFDRPGILAEMVAFRPYDPSIPVVDSNHNVPSGGGEVVPGEVVNVFGLGYPGMVYTKHT